MILGTEKPSDSTLKKLLEQVKSAKLQDTKSVYKNQLHFYALTTKYPNRK